MTFLGSNLVLVNLSKYHERKQWIILYRNMYIVKKLCFLYDVFKYYNGVPIIFSNLCFPTTNFYDKCFLHKQFVKQCFKQYFINVDIISLIFNSLFYFLFYVKVFLDIYLENTFNFKFTYIHISWLLLRWGIVSVEVRGHFDEMVTSSQHTTSKTLTLIISLCSKWLFHRASLPVFHLNTIYCN